MGRFGGRELSYASDLDVLFVYDGDGPADFDAAERVATQLLAEIGATTSEGRPSGSTSTLRPEGKRRRRSPVHSTDTARTTRSTG